MIVDLPSTTTTEVSKRLVRLRNNVGAMAMTRVLTLLIVVGEDDADAAVQTANDATRQHPARIVVLVRGNRRGRDRLDAQIRVGGDAGASEVVVLRLYGELADHGESVVTPLLLPDSPIVAWWPTDAPADVAGSPIGAMAHRRITDAASATRQSTELRRRAEHYAPGDTDLTWTRITRWRGLLAAALDQPPYEQVERVTVTAEADHAGADLLAGWLAESLRVPVVRARSAAGTGLAAVRMQRASGPVDLVQGDDALATLLAPDQPPRLVPLADPGLPSCLADELRRLDADEIYAAALREGRDRVTRRTADAALPEQATRPSRRRSRSTMSQSRDPFRRVFDTPAEVADAVAAAVDTAMTEAVAGHGIAHLSLTGGSMGNATVAALAARDLDPAVWRHVHLWWGDERFVPAGDPDRNDQQAQDEGLDRLPVPAAQVHRVPAGADEADLDAAATAYALEMARWATPPADDRDPEDPPLPVPAFDVMLLGMGPDAHCASLFPGRDELRITDAATVPVRSSPKPPPLRVSMTVPALCASRRVWFVVTGTDKAGAVAAAKGRHDDPQLPVTWVRGQLETIWWLDTAAAGDG